MTWIALVLPALLVAVIGAVMLRNHLHLQSLDAQTRGEIEDMQVRILEQDRRDARMDPKNHTYDFLGDD